MNDTKASMTFRDSNLCVVFVHLGVAKVPHLWLNIERFVELFPEIEIHLVLDQTSHLKHTKKLKCDVFIYNSKQSENTIVGLLSHNDSFRDGFWTYSMERIAALDSWHDQNKDKKLLHIESDILLLPNFPFEFFTKINNMAWTNVGPGKDCAAVLYSSSYLNTRSLASSILESVRIDNELTDMSALYNFRIENSDEIELLANGLESSDNLSLDGVFDSAAIGMWLLGQDPRNHYGWLKKHLPHKESSIDPSLYSYVFDTRDCLRISRDGRSEFLYNLHVHSKDLRLFGKKWRESLRKDVELGKTNNPRRLNRIQYKVLLDLIFDFFVRNGLDLKKVWKMIFEVRNRRNTE
jgi:hypothetical protein